jgi:hypothetical protein
MKKPRLNHILNCINNHSQTHNWMLTIKESKAELEPYHSLLLQEDSTSNLEYD